MNQSNTPDEIRADIERTRHELGQDVDALAEKVSPRKAVSRQTSRVRDGFVAAKENIMGTPEPRPHDVAGERARHLAHDARGTVHDVAGQARDTAHGVAEDARGTAHGVADQARQYAHQAGDAASQWTDDAQHALQQAPARVRGRTAGSPFAAGLIALGAGWLIGSLIPSSTAEQRAAGRAREQASPYLEQAREQAGQVVQEMREQVEPEAREAAARLKDSAAESAQGLGAEGRERAQGVAAETQEAAGRVKGAAKHA